MVLGFNLELQPRLPWQFHLRTQAHQVVWLHSFHSPEIERFSHAHRVGITSPAPEAYPRYVDEQVAVGKLRQRVLSERVCRFVDEDVRRWLDGKPPMMEAK